MLLHVGMSHGIFHQVVGWRTPFSMAPTEQPLGAAHLNQLHQPATTDWATASCYEKPLWGKLKVGRTYDLVEYLVIWYAYSVAPLALISIMAGCHVS
jgi:hypothetical protein